MNSIRSFLLKSWERTIVRFLCVGSFNTLLDLTILNVLVELAGLPPVVANTVSVTVGFTLSYFLNHRIVFRHPQKYSLQGYVRFFLITGLGVIVIQNLVIHVATHAGIAQSAHSYHLLTFDVSTKTVVLNAAKMAAVIIGIAWNFLLYKYVVFRKQDQPDTTDKIIVA